MSTDAEVYCKPTVVTLGVSDPVWFALGVAFAVRNVWQLGSTVVTSMRDGQHMDKSLHYVGCAVDVRSHDLSQNAETAIAREIKAALFPLGFDVVLESEPRHIHIEYDPKPGRVFLRPEPTAPAVQQASAGAPGTAAGDK